MVASAIGFIFEFLTESVNSRSTGSQKKLEMKDDDDGNDIDFDVDNDDGIVMM